MDDGARLLAIGDMHLGTTCSGVPEDISSFGIDPVDLTPAAAFGSSVSFAIEREVDAVLLAGDVVESTNARFEAMRPLEAGVRQLLDAGIGVIAVAGNHDVDALPRLGTLIDGFDLLGAGGRWEARTIVGRGAPVAQVVGWSFPERQVRQSPLAQLLAEPLERVAPEVPRLGLLHADLDAAGGNCAPIRRNELDNTGYDAWLLGHIHKPSIEGLSGAGGTRPSGYLGSLVGLDPSETGPHGPWLIIVRPGEAPKLEHVPLAPLRWEEVEISVAGLEHVDDVPDLLLSKAEEFVRALAETDPAPRALGLRVRLIGESTIYGNIKRWIGSGEGGRLARAVDDTVVFVSRIDDAMELSLNLEEIAEGEDPAALLARRLLILEYGGEQSRPIIEQARMELGDIVSQEQWSPVGQHRNATDALSDEALRSLLYRSGKVALNAMLASVPQGTS